MSLNRLVFCAECDRCHVSLFVCRPLLYYVVTVCYCMSTFTLLCRYCMLLYVTVCRPLLYYVATVCMLLYVVLVRSVKNFHSRQAPKETIEIIHLFRFESMKKYFCRRKK